jgi:outer membrane lipoprotein-sorting protein
VRRPNRLSAESTGDDGSMKFLFDGKTGYVYSSSQNKYAEIPVPGGTIEGLLKEAVGRLGVDFPLADFLSEAPNKAFLTGVTAGRVVNTVTIDGAPYLHLFFTQPPGIELELWLSNDAQALPRRLIVTYRTLPGAPTFIALFSDWNFNIHPSDAEFTFQPPAGAQKVALKPVAATPPAKSTSKVKRREMMSKLPVFALAAVAAAGLAAPEALGWGAYHGGFGGASYHGAYGGSFSRGGGSWSASTARGGSASGGGGSWSAHGAYGGSASGGGGSWSGTGRYGGTASGGGGSWSAHGAYGGTAYGYHGAYYGGGTYYHGGNYYGGTTVVTPGYSGWGAAAAGAAVGVAATSAAYAAASTNYYPPPYYSPYPY